MESPVTPATAPDGIPSRRAAELVSDSFATVRYSFWGFVLLGVLLTALAIAASFIPFASVVVAPVTATAGVVAAVTASLIRTVSALGSVGAGFKLLLPVLGATLLYQFAIILLFITIIGIPYAMHLAVRWGFIVQAIVLEKLGVRAAFSRSTELVRGQWWRVLGCELLMWLAIFGVFIVVFGVWFILIIIVPLIGIVLLLVLLPLALAFSYVPAVFNLLLYVDLRVRKEGYSRSQIDGEIAAYA